MDKKDIPVFLKYIITQPFVELRDLIHGMAHNLNRPKFWFYIIFFVVIIKIVVFKGGNVLVDRLILVALALIILWKEYDDGRWKAQWREEEKRKIMEKVRKEMEQLEKQEQGGNKNV